MAEWIDNVMNKLTVVAEDALEQLGEDVQVDIAQSISTPYPPASSPGEDPHLRLGHLKRGLGHGIERGNDAVTLIVSSSRVEGHPDVPFWLAVGTPGGRMKARPYMQNAFNRWGPRFPARVAISVRSGMSS